MSNLEGIFESLGLTRDNGLYITSENNWKSNTSFPNRVKRLLERKIEPDAFFCFSNKPLILFFSNPADKEHLHKAIWNFNECPIAIIVENDTIEIFNGFHFLIEKKTLEKLGGEEKLNDFRYFELVTGKTWEQYEANLGYKNRVDYHLLDNIKAARKVLIENHAGDSQNEKRDARITNALIGKCIFIRYLIDRKVKMKFDGKLRTWTNAEFCDLLNSPKRVRQFFDYIEDNEDGFNGDLFPLSSSEYGLVTKEDYQVLQRLLKGDDIADGQFSLFELYDFSIIPIEFISNVYELFIGQDNQKKEGAYYTPLFLVDYILKETVETKLDREATNFTCKVLDPACGSGIFLVETLRKIIEKYIADTGIEIKSDKFKTAIKNLAKENIYGVDKDLSAVQVAVFSIYLTLLDYLEPPGIETFKFPMLFNTNFFEADFFDQDHSFNSNLRNIEFDFILGNPPWKGNGMDSVGNRYVKERKKREKALNKKFEIAINNNEIAEGFILRVSDFCSVKTNVSFIVRSSSLYNLGYNNEFSPFRQYWLEEYFVDKIFELAPVRHEVFEKSNQPAVAPAAVLFYRYANGLNTDQNKVEHIALKASRFFTLFKIFTINRTDFKIIQQNRLKEFDWLWKTLVYGSYLDFNLIRRLKSEFKTVKDKIADEEKFVVGTGIQYSSEPAYNAKHLKGRPFVDSYGVMSFFIDPERISTFDTPKVHRLRDERLFKAPMLLFREGIDMDDLVARSAVSTKDVLFKGSISSIKAIKNADLKVLKNISAVFNTSLFSYYAIQLFTTIGIERERVTNYNKFSLPYLDIDVKDNVDRIESAHKKIHKEEKKALQNGIEISNQKKLIQDEVKAINLAIFEKIKLSPVELSLLNYSLEISRHFIIGDADQRSKLFEPIRIRDEYLEKYVRIYISRFKANLETKGQKFIANIWYTKQVIGILFKLLPREEAANSRIIWEDKQDFNYDILKTVATISSQKITDRLFVQKDIRGFEKDSFYIFKPNERRLWHEAIAYLDVNEFADAILKSAAKE